jgi:peptidoglycan glycosyltransferase
MKRIAKRTVASLILVVLLLAGFGFYVIKWMANGQDWAAFAVNRHAYSDGVLATGSIVDANGTALAFVQDGARAFSSDYDTRRAALHVVGDTEGNIGTGLLYAFDTELMGYNPLTGLYSVSGEGHTLHTTIDIDVCKVAVQALGYNKGAVVVYNYKTGEVVCMVSSPGFDPLYPPDLSGYDGTTLEGAYINRALSSTFTPGSIFKLVTLQAAIETDPDIWNRTFYCDGGYEIGYDVITCTEQHGAIDIHDALAYSCNCAFAELALVVGGETIEKYAEKAGLLDTFTMSGVRVAAGRYDIAAAGSSDLAWSGIGQYTDLVNPLAMARYMGAIANGGAVVAPRIVDKITTPMGIPFGLYGRGTKTRLLSAETADTLKEMMRYNVTSYYGQDRFPGLALGGKSGTAEVEPGVTPHAWFVGFTEDKDKPYAFAVFVENGGWGVSVAGAVANEVLQAIADETHA